jgi:ribosomal protein L24
MPMTIRKVDYIYVMVGDKPGEAGGILTALKDANLNLLAFSGFPQGRNRSQIDLVTDNLEGLKAVAKRHKWKLSRTKRAFLGQGTDEVGAAVEALATVGAAKINIIAADVISAGEGRCGMLFWVEPRNYNRAATLLQAS